MKPYRVQTPANYLEIRDLGDKVHDTILARRVPQPDHIAQVLGEEAVKAYYLMHALLYAVEHKRGKGVPTYKRRDKKAIQRHSYDGAFKPFYRLKDRRLPSRYLLTKSENIGVLVHDLGEEFGKSLLGALVVNDIIGRLLGEETGRDADLLTNKNALLFGPLEDEIAEIEPSKINHNSAYNAFGKLKSQVTLEPGSVLWQYRRVLQALKSFRGYVTARVDYMPDLQKKALIGVLDELADGVNDKIRGGILTAQEVTGHITNQYGNVMSIMEAGKYIKADKRLLTPEDIEFLVTLKKTLYADFIRNIAEAVKKSAASQKEKSGDIYVAPMMESLSESTDTVANMDLTLSHATSIFRKARVRIVSGIESIEDLRQQGYDYQRLQRSVDYLFRNLDSVVSQHLEYLQERSQSENTWERDLVIFTTMKEKMSELERRVKAIEEPGLVRGAIRGVGTFFGVTELNLGRMHLTF